MKIIAARDKTAVLSSCNTTFVQQNNLITSWNDTEQVKLWAGKFEVECGILHV